MRVKIRYLTALILILLIIEALFLATASYDDNWHHQSSYEEMKTSWTYVTDSPDEGGYGECVASDGKYIYILKQYNALKSPYFWRYDPSRNRWADLSSNLPNVDFKNGLSMAYDYYGNFYVLLGSAYGDGSNRVYFYKYNISTDTWTRLADTPHVQGAGDAIVYSGYDDKLYAFMGRAHYTGTYTPPDHTYSIFARYDPGTNTWEQLKFPPWPGTDDGCSLAWTGGRYIYALAGEFEETKPNTNFSRYDIVTNTLEKMANIPAPDGVGDGGSLLWIGYYDSSYDDVIFALGGNGCKETPGYNFSMYHISTNTWEKLDDLPYPIGDYVGNRLGYANGKIYYWQGTPDDWSGGGTKICYYVPPAIPELAPIMIIIPAVLFIVLFRKRSC